MASHRGRAFWSRHVAACGHGGLTRAAYCRQHGLDYGTFRRWARRIAEEPPERASVQALVPLRVSTASPHGEDALRIEVGAGVALAMPQSVDPCWLAALLRELAC